MSLIEFPLPSTVPVYLLDPQVHSLKCSEFLRVNEKLDATLCSLQRLSAEVDPMWSTVPLRLPLCIFVPFLSPSPRTEVPAPPPSVSLWVEMKRPQCAAFVWWHLENLRQPQTEWGTEQLLPSLFVRFQWCPPRGHFCVKLRIAGISYWPFPPARLEVNASYTNKKTTTVY